MGIEYKVVFIDEAYKDKLPGFEDDKYRSTWDFRYVLHKYVDGEAVEFIGDDYMEPEDALLVRDLDWVVDALNKAYQEGYTPVIIDAEGSITDEWLEHCGIDKAKSSIAP